MARKTKLIEVRGRPRWLFVETTPVEDPACGRDEDDPAGAFAQYILPKLKAGKDQASREVVAAMKAGRSLSDAIADTIQSLPVGKTRNLRNWVDDAQSSRVYRYVSVDILNENTTVGVLLTEGAPTEPVLANEKMEDLGFEAFPQYHRLNDVLPEFAAGAMVDDYIPFVLVNSRAEYDQALQACDIAKSKGRWVASGIYNFEGVGVTDKAVPTYVSTKEEFEAEAAREEAESVFHNYGFWDQLTKAACARLRNA